MMASWLACADAFLADKGAGKWGNEDAIARQHR